ncbi:MAG: glycosyltransferase [Nitriliruptorales bacterium]|nr:glycosyltransferase [Nitriliruptorales bacterium]
MPDLPDTPPRAHLPGRRWPSVSIVVVNFDGRDYLERCLGSLRRLDYPADRIEVIFIDNASTDGSVEYVRSAFPEVRVVVNEENTGFSPAVNQGAQLASGDHLALLNNDAEADPDWIKAAVQVLDLDDRVACVASKILRDDRRTVDFAGGQMAFYGHGFAKGNREPDDPSDSLPRPTLFASGGAMIVRRELFLDVGGFDASYFAFFEDVDFGWRLWVLGHEVRYVPDSVVYHRHHGTIARFGYPRERYLLERNALATVFKNYGDEMLARTLPGTLVLALLRGLADPDTELADYTIRDDPSPITEGRVSALTGAHLAAVRDWGLSLDTLGAKRYAVQSQRKVDDHQLSRLFERPLLPNVPDADFLRVFEFVLNAWNLREHLKHHGHVLIITADRLGKRMAGPAIRCWEMAKLLSRQHRVTLGTTAAPELEHPGFDVVQVNSERIDALLAETDLVIFQGFIMFFYPQIAASDVPVLVDIYDPFHLEGLELRREEAPVERFSTIKSDTRILNQQLERGDFFVCASDKQRDFWLGQMTAVGRVNPATYDQDPSLRRLVDVAPFGLPSDPPVKREQVIKGVIHGIGEDDFLLLWGGGIYNWFDPLTLINALGIVAADHPDMKLFFLGSAHPNPDVPEMRMAADAYRLAEERGLLDKHVFFNPGWVEYEKRADYLLEADLGVSTHFEHIETAFSYRTRILDYLWASLPIVATEGDSLSRLVNQHGLGLTVPAENVDQLASALRRLHNDRSLYQTCKANVEALAPEMTWERALAPIVDFANQPRHAADRAGRPAEYVKAQQLIPDRSASYLARRFYDYYRAVGPKAAVHHARNFLRMRLGR